MGKGKMAMREKLIELIFVGQVLADSMCDKQAECNKCPYHAPNACRMGAMVDHLIANGVTVKDSKLVEIDQFNKWIPVSERLPEYGQQVIVYFGNLLSKQVMAYHFWSKDFGGWALVTHWMPLPEPPKEG